MSDEKNEEVEGKVIGSEPEIADNVATCQLRGDGSRVYEGSVKFKRFTFPVWRAWRGAIRDKSNKSKLKAFEADEAETILSYWSGAAVIEEWDIYYTDDDGEKVAVERPVPGVLPPDDIYFALFSWFRRVANDYIVPRLGMYPKL